MSLRERLDSVSRLTDLPSILEKLGLFWFSSTIPTSMVENSKVTSSSLLFLITCGYRNDNLNVITLFQKIDLDCHL